MTTAEVLSYYGSVRRVADALGVSTQSVYAWGERPPMVRQYQIEIGTSGELRADAQAVEGDRAE